MHPAGYHLAQSLHAFLPQRAQRDALARTGRQARRAHCRSHHSQKGANPGSAAFSSPHRRQPRSPLPGPHPRWLTARHPVTSRTWTRVRPSLVQRGPPPVQQPAPQLPVGRHHPGRLRHRGVPDSLPSRQAGERGPGLHHTLALRLRHPVRPRSRPHLDQRQRRWNPPTTAWPGTWRASRGRTARLRRADDHSLIRAWVGSHVRAEAATVPQLYMITHRLREDLGGRASAPFGAAGRGLLAGLVCRTRGRCGFADEFVRRPCP
jgi:hypothetical protein